MPAARQKSCAATCNRTESASPPPRMVPTLCSGQPTGQPAVWASALPKSPSWQSAQNSDQLPDRPQGGRAARWTGRKVDGPQGGRAARWTGRKVDGPQKTGSQKRGELPRPQSGRATLKGLGPSASLTRGAPPHPSWARATQAGTRHAGPPSRYRQTRSPKRPVSLVEPSSLG
ncbi:MAG: hypothetical protein ACJARR_000187 [Pseudophaeobacter arcticus]|jgi:hypothetical protein